MTCEDFLRAAARQFSDNKTKIVQKPGPGWYVQLAASNNAEDATTLAGKLHARGLLAQIQKTQVKNVTYSRVLVGPYRSRVAALDDQQKIRSWGVAKGEPFLRYLSED